MRIELELKGFTPVPDRLIEEFNVSVAAIYGVVWRYCQMEDRVCKASLAKIAARVGLSAKTAERHVRALAEAGYLEDLTPDVRNRPHEYALTDKLNLYGSVVAGEGGTSKCRTKVRQNVVPRYVKMSYEDSPLRDSLKERDLAPDKTDQIERPEPLSVEDKDRLNTLADAVGDLCKIKLETARPATRALLHNFVLQIDKEGATIASVGEFREYWYTWAKNPPRIRQMPEEWDRWWPGGSGSEIKSKGPVLSEAEKQALEALQNDD